MRQDASGAARHSVTSAAAPQIARGDAQPSAAESPADVKGSAWSRLWEPFQRARPIPLPQTGDDASQGAAAGLDGGF